MCLRIITCGRWLLTLWSALYLLANPLVIAGLWSEPPCAIHGDTCPCPEMCRQAKGPAALSAPTGCPSCHAANTEVTEATTDESTTSAARCWLSSGCRSEQEQAVTALGHPYLPSVTPVSAYIPIDQETFPEGASAAREGYVPPPFHPPEV